MPKTTSVRLNDEVVEQLDELASSLNSSASAVMNEAVTYYYKKHKGIDSKKAVPFLKIEASAILAVIHATLYEGYFPAWLTNGRTKDFAQVSRGSRHLYAIHRWLPSLDGSDNGEWLVTYEDTYYEAVLTLISAWDYSAGVGEEQEEAREFVDEVINSLPTEELTQEEKDTLTNFGYIFQASGSGGYTQPNKYLTPPERHVLRLFHRAASAVLCGLATWQDDEIQLYDTKIDVPELLNRLQQIKYRMPSRVALLLGLPSWSSYAAASYHIRGNRHFGLDEECSYSYYLLKIELQAIRSFVQAVANNESSLQDKSYVYHGKEYSISEFIDDFADTPWDLLFLPESESMVRVLGDQRENWQWISFAEIANLLRKAATPKENK